MDEPMTASEYERWTHVRTQGVWLYGLKRFVPTYGLLFASVTLGYHLLVGKVTDWPIEMGEFVVKAIIFGLIMGWIQWRQNEASLALGPPTPGDETPAECLECGTSIPAGEMRCPVCGWTYDGADKTDP